MKDRDYITLKIDMILDGKPYKGKLQFTDEDLTAKRVKHLGSMFIDAAIRTMYKVGFLAPLYWKDRELKCGPDELFELLKKEEDDERVSDR